MLTKDEIFLKSKHYTDFDGQKLSENFSYMEFACKSTGKVYIDRNFIKKLEELRTAMGDNPMIITSGYRSPKHNSFIAGAAKNSLHQFGKAADISCCNLDGNKLAEEAKRLGFSEIIKYTESDDNFVHVAIGKEQNPFYDMDDMFPISDNRFNKKPAKNPNKFENDELMIGGGAIIIYTYLNKDGLIETIETPHNTFQLEGLKYIASQINFEFFLILGLIGFIGYNKFSNQIKGYFKK